MRKWKSWIAVLLRPVTTVSIRRFMLPSGVYSSCRMDSLFSDGKNLAKSCGDDGRTLGSTTSRVYTGNAGMLLSS